MATQQVPEDILDPLIGGPEVYIVSHNTQRAHVTNKTLYSYRHHNQDKVGYEDYKEDDKCKWLLKSAGKNREFYIVTGETQQRYNKMIYLTKSGKVKLRDFVEDERYRWKYIPRNPESGWIVSTATASNPNQMIFLNHGCESWVYWNDTRTLWKILPAVPCKVKDLKYDLNSVSYGNKTVVNSVSQSTENNSSVPQTIKWTFRYTKEKASTFEVTQGWSLAASAQIIAGVPSIAGGSVGVSGSMTKSFTNGETKSASKSKTYDFPVVCPARKRIEGQLICSHQAMDIRWQGKLYFEGFPRETDVSGVWYGVASHHLDVKVTEHDLPASGAP